MSTLLRYPKGYQFFGPDGAPLSLGTLTYYIAGTSTLQDTYSDSDGASVNTNPIVLDQAGRLDVDVYLGSAADYKEVLATGSATIAPWPDDDIPQAVQADWNVTSGPSQILNKPTLAAVATSGSYADLSNTPSAFIGDSGSGGASGFVPAPPAGAAAAGKFLKADGGWSVTNLASCASGAYTVALNATANTSLTLPAGGTLATGLQGVTSYTIAPSGGDYSSLAAALAGIDAKYFGLRAIVRLTLADGIYTSSSPITILDQSCARIYVSGNTYQKTITGVQSSSGVSGAWSVTLNLSDVNNIYAGGCVVIGRLTGGTAPDYLAGCHVVTAVDTANKRITILVTSLWGIASGAVTGNLYFMGATLAFNDCNGIEVFGVSGLNLAGVALLGNHNYGDGSSYAALDIQDNSRLYVGSNGETIIGVNGFAYGGRALYASHIIGNTIAVSNGHQAGLNIAYCSVSQVTSYISGCGYGHISTGNANIRHSTLDVLVGNRNANVYARNGGNVITNSDVVNTGNVVVGNLSDTYGTIAPMNGAGVTGNNLANARIAPSEWNVVARQIVNPPSNVTTDTAPIAQEVIYANGCALALTTNSTEQGVSLSFGESNGSSRILLQKDANNKFSIYTGTGNAGAEVYTERFSLDTSGNIALITAGAFVKATPAAVSGLTAAATAGAGARSMVSDSTVAASGNFGAIVTGGGSNTVPVFSDGASWRIG